MCLLALSIAPHPSVRFVLAANRDEAFERPTREAHVWEDAPQVIGGRDLRAGGSWLGVARTGRLAAVTNVRAVDARREGRSRGEIVRRFLSESEPASSYARALVGEAERLPSFNAIVGDAEDFFYVNDRDPEPLVLGSGVHAVSNGRLGDPWPKVERARAAVAVACSNDGVVDVEALFVVLADRTPPPDADLPSTGVPLAIERLLAPPFVVGDIYGTRCSTVVVASRSGRLVLEERSFGPGGHPTSTVRLEL